MTDETIYAIKTGGNWSVAILVPREAFGSNPSIRRHFSRNVWQDVSSTAYLCNEGEPEFVVQLEPRAAEGLHAILLHGKWSLAYPEWSGDVLGWSLADGSRFLGVVGEELLAIHLGEEAQNATR